MNAFGNRALGARPERMQTSTVWSGLFFGTCFRGRSTAHSVYLGNQVEEVMGTDPGRRTPAMA